MMTTHRAGGGCKAGRAAFTLIELLIVIAIIAIIISIVLPALAHVRVVARKTATKAMLTDISNAASSFQNDNRHMPGYFSAREMGSSSNGGNSASTGEGFSAMQNVMLDLAGAPVAGPGYTGQILRVGPDSTKRLDLAVDLLGVNTNTTNNKLYWMPDKKFYTSQKEISGQQAATNPDNTELPSVVDHFGAPILAWVADDAIVKRPSTIADFAAVNSPAPNQAGSRYYVVSNAAFLNATSLGKRAVDQTSTQVGSLLSPVGYYTSCVPSLAGALGNPSQPARDASGQILNPAVPAAPRAPFMVQSAGADGLYLGHGDRGAKQFADGRTIDYTINFFTDTARTGTYTDKDGKPTSIDILEKFDDVWAQGGN